MLSLVGKLASIAEMLTISEAALPPPGERHINSFDSFVVCVHLGGTATTFPVDPTLSPVRQKVRLSARQSAQHVRPPCHRCRQSHSLSPARLNFPTLACWKDYTGTMQSRGQARAE